STGRKVGATILSGMRSGVLFIPSILLLSHFRGLAGIQEAQPLAFVLSFPISVLFIYIFFKKYGEKAQEEKARASLR
ncbi:MAG: MATE family efflux transporter, partial [Lachnospiraceae bacterium]|nr:MATE family efflux transporter [Lachnospiraceae bacterium]